MTAGSAALAGWAPPTTVAMVWTGGSDIEKRALSVPNLADGDVLVAIDLAAICGSDRHTVSGGRMQPHPSVLGHESVGRVVATRGAVHAVNGTPVRIGDRVIWSVTLPCGACDRCRAGITAKCRSVRKTGHEPLDGGWALSGGYAEHIVLPAGMPIALVPGSIPDALAAPAACATATVMAVIERAGELGGRRVAVIGAGMLGLTAAAAASDAGAAEVLVADLSAERRALAERFGATSTAEGIDELGALDVLIELSGSTRALQQGLAQLDVGGVAVLAGAVAPDGLLAISPETVVRNHLAIRGQHNYEPRHVSAALAFLDAAGARFPWHELVAAPLPLNAVQELLLTPPGTMPRYTVSPALR